MSEHAFLCASCGKARPGTGNRPALMGSAAERLAQALHDLHAEAAEADGYQVQFEILVERVAGGGKPTA